MRAFFLRDCETIKMSSCSGTSAPPHFNGYNYHSWAVKMEIHLKSLSLWEVVLDDGDRPLLRDTSSLTQIKRHEDEVAKKPRALACIHSKVSESVFSRILPYKTPKSAWGKLKKEFDGGHRSRRIKLFKIEG